MSRARGLLFSFVLAAAAAGPAPLGANGRKPPKRAPAASKTSEAPATEKARIPERDEVRSEPRAPRAGRKDAPVTYWAALSNPNDYGLFANGGWDGNWYVGYNTCWIVQLPPLPPGRFVRAYVGAKLGRMKTEPVPGRPSWEKKPIAGEIHIALATEPLWPESHRFVLTPTDGIPLEGDPENAVEGVGEGEWFWVEVPMNFLSAERNHYVALFSPSENLKDAAHAPILAAAWGSKQQSSWLQSSAKGEPPANPADALRTPVSYFQPAIALKLVPENDRAVRVDLQSAPSAAAPLEKDVILGASVRGDDIARAWVEISTDTKTWAPAGRPLWKAPFIFTLKKDGLPAGDVSARVLASDVYENMGASESVRFQVLPSTSTQGKR